MIDFVQNIKDMLFDYQTSMKTMIKCFFISMILIVFLIIIVPSYANSHAIQKRETINVYKNISSSGKGTTIRQEKLLNFHTFIEIITSDFRSKLLLPHRLYWLGNTFIRSQ